jgi:transcriptional regulator with PAS, ATPase and Fis domain
LIDGHLMIGESTATRQLKAYLLRVAQTDSNVLITGETGTGKELAAELIHRNGPRRHRPLVAINCAAIPDSLFESEMFGYERGAFTGAHASQEGKLKQADHGSVFFDEIGDMSLYAQVKILRVIERREVQRLGGRPLPIDIRIIAATNRPLEEVSEDRFRRDLFFRLNVARVHLLPLRERRDDIQALARHFIAGFNHMFGRDVRGLSPDAASFFYLHPWPGNIRELKNLIESAFIDLPEEHVALLELPTPLRGIVQRAPHADSEELERIVRALWETNWNKSQAAQRLQWSRMTLYRKMARYQLSAESKDKLAKLQ